MALNLTNLCHQSHRRGYAEARPTVQMLHELERQDKQFGMSTMCIGGGMGAAGIFERLN